MNLKSLLSLVLALSLTTATGCDQEQQNPAGTQASGASATPPEVTQHDSLHDLMEELADSFKFLHRHTEEGEANALLEQSATIRALAAQAKAMTPEQVEEADEAEREQLTQAFQKHLGEIGPALDAYDAAIQAEDRAAAAAAVEQLNEAKEHGHEALGVGDDH